MKSVIVFVVPTEPLYELGAVVVSYICAGSHRDVSVFDDICRLM